MTKNILDNYKDLLSVSDLAEIFETTNGTVYKEINKGTFGEPIKIGRKYIIPKVYIKKKFFETKDL